MDEVLPPDLSLKSTVITLRSGLVVNIPQIAEALVLLDDSIFRQVLERVVELGGGPHIEMLLRAITIQRTTSLFINPVARAAVEKTAEQYPFSHWLEWMNIPFSSATRTNLIDWWGGFMNMAAELGYQAPGRIDEFNQGTNLWQATAHLAKCMSEQPAKYRYLPPLLANHATEIDRVLGEIADAGALIEMLTGEALPDIRTSPIFLGAFSTLVREGVISRTVPDAIFSVDLVLKRTDK